VNIAVGERGAVVEDEGGGAGGGAFRLEGGVEGELFPSGQTQGFAFGKP